QLVEQVLGQMAQGHQLGGVEKARAALDGVKAPEDVVEQALVVGRAFEIDELVVDARQQIPGLDQEVLQQIFHSREITHDRLASMFAPDALAPDHTTPLAQKPRL